MQNKVRSVVCFLGLLIAGTVAASPDDVILPVIPVTPPPTPTPTTGVPVLTEDALYVIQSKKECVVRAHPVGLVKVTKKKGPRDMSAKFVDGNGKMEDRTYDSPFIYVVQAIGTGRVVLDIIPLGLKAETEIVTVTIDVESGQGPIPPPKPKPDPKPDVKPDPVTSFRVILIYESGDNLTIPQRAVVYGKVVEEFLNANCTGGKNGWRRRDKNVPGELDATMKALWAAVQPKVTVTPCVAVERNGAVEIINLEPSPDKMVETLKKYLEGK